MAEVEKFAPFVLKWEGGAKYTNNKHNKNKTTKYKITITT